MAAIVLDSMDESNHAKSLGERDRWLSFQRASTMVDIKMDDVLKNQSQGAARSTSLSNVMRNTSRRVHQAKMCVSMCAVDALALYRASSVHV